MRRVSAPAGWHGIETLADVPGSAQAWSDHFSGFDDQIGKSFMGWATRSWCPFSGHGFVSPISTSLSSGGSFWRWGERNRTLCTSGLYARWLLPSCLFLAAAPTWCVNEVSCSPLTKILCATSSTAIGKGPSLLLLHQESVNLRRKPVCHTLFFLPVRGLPLPTPAERHSSLASLTRGSVPTTAKWCRVQRAAWQVGRMGKIS